MIFWSSGLGVLYGGSHVHRLPPPVGLHFPQRIQRNTIGTGDVSKEAESVETKCMEANNVEAGEQI